MSKELLTSDEQLENTLSTMTHEQLVRYAVRVSKLADQLQASLEGLHFHHKMFEQNCRHCQEALRE